VSASIITARTAFISSARCVSWKRDQMGLFV